MTITTLLAAVAFPFLLPFIVTAVLWRKLDRRLLFLAVSFFCVIGIDYLAFDIFNNALEPHTVDPESGNLVEAIEGYAHSRHIALLLTDTIVLVLGLGLMYWLFTALRRDAAENRGPLSERIVHSDNYGDPTEVVQAQIRSL